MEINDRIELLIGQLGFNPHSFARTLGIKSSSTIPNILRERDRKPSYEVLRKIAKRFPTINMNWLLTGDGDTFLKAVDNIPLVGDRVKRIMEFYRLSIEEMAARCGCTTGEVKAMINNGEYKHESLEMIFRAFPNISEKWLFQNKGRMFGSLVYKDQASEEPDNEGIPLFKATYERGMNTAGDPYEMLRVHGYEDCDFAIYNERKTLEPEVSPGDIILCKNADREMIVYGQLYMVLVKDHGFVSYVKRGKDKNHVELHGPKGTDVDPLTVKKTDINAMFMVRGVIKRFW